MTEQLPQKSLTPPIPTNEPERLAALHRYKILDTPPETAFDRITTLAARLFKMPIVLISLVDESRAWFKSCIGFNAREVPRDATLCSFAVLTDKPLIIPDTQLDDRFACNPFVQSEPGVRFYAGAPLLSDDGFNLGTLCLLDSQPHEPLTAEQQATLVDLAAMVVDELELRLAAHKIAQVDAALLEITQGVATATGGAFFDALVRHLAKVLDTDCVYIGLVEGDDPKRLRTIATFAHGQIADNLTYPLQDTPCWEAIEQRKICCYPRNVQAHFPNAPLLEPLCVESYIAAPFFNSNGTPLGLLGVMDGEPLENVHLAESLLTIFASRIATELERQQAETALRESETRFRILGEALPLIVSLARPDGQIEYVNPYWITFSGRTSEDFANGDWLAAVHPEDRQTMLEVWQRALAEVYPYEYEFRARAANGTYRWLLARGVPVCRTDGKVANWVNIAVDITERKLVEEQLRESERFLKGINETAPNLLYILDLNERRNLYVSPQIFSILGILSEDVQGIGSQLFAELFHPDDLEQIEQHHDRIRAAREDEIFTIEYRMKHLSGEWRWLTSRDLIFVRDSQGKPSQILGSAIDITERKQAEAALHDSEERYRAFVAHSSEGIWRFELEEPLSIAIDEHSQIEHLYQYAYLAECNQVMARMYGFSSIEEIVGVRLGELVPPSEPRNLDYLRAFIRSNYRLSDAESFEVDRFGNAKYFANNLVGIIQDGYLIRAWGNQRDINERKQAELQLQQQASELRQLNVALEQTASKLSERNQELDRFVYTVSHDLKAPLRAISNLSQWIEDDLEGQLNEDNQRQMQLLRQRVARMGDLIDGLLAYSRIGRTEVPTETVDVGELLGEILDSLSPPSGFTISVQPEMPKIVTKRLLLSQVFSNLISNAIKHHDRSDGRIEIRATQKGEYYEFSVIDDGSGIAPKDHDRIFGIFQTLKGRDVQESTGIGLSIVKKIIETEGGSIVLESDLGEGATFRFTWRNQHEATKTTK